MNIPSKGAAATEGGGGEACCFAVVEVEELQQGVV